MKFQVDMIETKQFRACVEIELPEGEDEYDVEEILSGTLFDDPYELVEALKNKGIEAYINHKPERPESSHIEILDISEID